MFNLKPQNMSIKDHPHELAGIHMTALIKWEYAAEIACLIFQLEYIHDVVLHFVPKRNRMELVSQVLPPRPPREIRDLISVPLTSASWLFFK